VTIVGILLLVHHVGAHESRARSGQ
jgi:hypothetical protein